MRTSPLLSHSVGGAGSSGLRIQSPGAAAAAAAAAAAGQHSKSGDHWQQHVVGDLGKGVAGGSVVLRFTHESADVQVSE